MSDYKKLLVAVDFSPAATQVGQRALNLARKYDAAMMLVHVVEYLPPLDVGYDPISTSDWAVDEHELVENARNSLQTLCENLGATDVEQIVQLGTPKHLIPEIADTRSVDLIVLGSHGRHGLGRLLGSTADGVLHHANCDVLAVRVSE